MNLLLELLLLFGINNVTSALNSNYLLSSAAVQLNNGIASKSVPSSTASIIRLNNDNNGDGTYRFNFETENRIVHQEQGQLKNAGTDQEANVIEGSYSYTGPDGNVYTVNYIADENGFRATGDHIPTAAPIPNDIAEAIQLNAAEEAAGFIDDGSYKPDYHKFTRKLAIVRQ